MFYNTPGTQMPGLCWKRQLNSTHWMEKQKKYGLHTLAHTHVGCMTAQFTRTKLSMCCFSPFQTRVEHKFIDSMRSLNSFRPSYRAKMNGVTEKWLSPKWTEQIHSLALETMGFCAVVFMVALLAHLCTYGMIHELLEAIENRICFALHFLHTFETVRFLQCTRNI